MTAMRWGRRIATGVVLVGLVAIGLGRGVGAQTGPAFSAQIQLALRALLAGDQTITGNWTIKGAAGIGTAASSDSGLNLTKSVNEGFGAWVNATLNGVGWLNAIDLNSGVAAGVAGGTIQALVIEPPTLGAGATLGTFQGIAIGDLSGVTVGSKAEAINYADKFIVDATGKTLIGPDLATLTAADAYITGNGLADSTTRITELNPTTSAMASWILQTDATTTYAFSDTAEFYNFLGGTQGGDAQALYVRTFGTGDISEIDGQWVYPGHTSTGTLGTLRYVALGDPDKAGGAGAIGTVQAIWVPALSGWGSANTYSFWHDADGVFRIKEDNHFDSVYQAIPALYNPQFTKYTAGAVNYERIVQQWESNVAVITTEAGGTGTLRSMQLGDANVHVQVSDLKNTGAATGKKVVCVDTATGQLYASSTGTDCSN